MPVSARFAHRRIVRRAGADKDVAYRAGATGKTGGALAAALQQATNPIACPSDTSAYAFFPALDGGALQTCQGGVGHNSWYGSGEVDALKAVGG